MKVSDQTLAISAAAGAGIQVGAAIAATRVVVHDVGPFSLAFLRYAIALACFLPFAWGALKSAPPLGALVPLVLLGVLQFGLLMALLNVGLLFVPAAIGAMIFSSLPLVTLLIAWGLGREAITPFTVCAIGLVMTGVCLAAGQYTVAEGGAMFLLGAGAVIAATLCGAIASILYRDHAAGVPILIVILTGLAAAAAFLLPPALFELHSKDFALPAVRLWPIIIFIGASSAIGFYLWIFALSRASATSVAICVASAPISAAVLGMLLLSETLDQGVFLGLTCVVAAFFLLHRQPLTREGPRL